MADIDLDAVLARHGRTRADLVGLGFSMRTVDYWRSGGPSHPSAGRKPTSRPSVRAALLIEKELGIPRHELRPDIWPPPAKPKARRREAVAA
jgi:hypothetical protein